MKKKAFTLLELIIVIIVVSVLASIALPRFLRVIRRSKSVEAMTSIASLRFAFERYYLMHNGSYEGAGLNDPPIVNNLGMEDPGLSPGAHFQYEALGGDNWYRIYAKEYIDGNPTKHNIYCVYNVGIAYSDPEIAIPMIHFCSPIGNQFDCCGAGVFRGI